LTSKAGQASSGNSPRKRFTPTISSLTVTVPSALQSPTQVGTGVGVGVGPSVEVWVTLDVTVGLAVVDNEGVGVRVAA